ncbi:MAG: hypothetical protein FK734_02000 [Asgard group archaeon]|nr:hypothetical protein [Asgard group archaeon]
MAAEAQWLFITDKYSLVEFIDSAIVVARFNQNELMRELIAIRCKLLESKNYDDFAKICDLLTLLSEKITDDRLNDVVSKLIDQIAITKNDKIKFEEKPNEIESRAID